jgi:N-acetylmuramic acid 6-phosphate etherase
LVLYAAEENQLTEHGTESHNHLAAGLDKRSPAEILSIMHQSQMQAARSVASAHSQIAGAASALARTIRGGGNIIYAAAGSSALMALADGLELPGTFSIPVERVRIIMAGGRDSLMHMTGAPEDDTAQANADMTATGLSPEDCVIGLSASGSTPYSVEALKTAAKAGATTIAIACNRDTPLLNVADIAIFLPTPPEIVSGSTRLGAATAQKITLNMISTLMAMELGHVYDGYMVNLHADNAKLEARAHTMVAAISGCPQDTARTCLEKADGSVKTAILLAAGARDSAAAKQLLASNRQKLRPSLSILQKGSRPPIS